MAATKSKGAPKYSDFSFADFQKQLARNQPLGLSGYMSETGFQEGSGDSQQFLASAPLYATGGAQFQVGKDGKGYWVLPQSSMGGAGGAATGYRVAQQIEGGRNSGLLKRGLTIGDHAKEYNGQYYDQYDADGNFLGSGQWEGLGGLPAWQGLLATFGAAAGAAALGAGTAAGAGAGATGGGAGAAAGGGLGAAELGAGAGLGFGAPMGAEAVAAYGGLTASEAAVAASLGMSPEAFAALGAQGLGSAGAAAGMGAGTAAAAGGAGGAGAGGAGAGGGAAGTAANGGGFMQQVSGMLGSGGGGWSSLIGPAMSALGGWMQNDAAKDAAAAQMGAVDRGIAENRRQFDTVQRLLAPYVQAGTTGLAGYQQLGGMAGAGPQQQAINALQAGPEFSSLTKQGENAILQNAAATGGLRGGNTQGSLADFRSNLLTGLIERQMGRYGNLVGVGQNSAAGTGTAALNTGRANAELMQQGGAAQAGGIVAGTNAITNAMGSIGGMMSAGSPVQSGAPANPYYTPSFGTGTVAPSAGGARF